MKFAKLILKVIKKFGVAIHPGLLALILGLLVGAVFYSKWANKQSDPPISSGVAWGIAVLGIVIACLVMYLRYRAKAKTEAPEQEKKPQLGSGELVKTYNTWLKGQRPEYRRAIESFQPLVSVATEGADSHRLISSYTNWQQLEEQSRYSETRNSNLRIYQSSAAVVQDIPTHLLSQGGPEVHAALRNLWNKTHAGRASVMVVAISYTQLMKAQASEIAGWADRVRGKANLLAIESGRPVHLRIALTDLGAVPGYGGFARFASEYDVPTTLNPDSFDTEAIREAFQELESYVPLALTSLQADEYRTVLSFLHQTPEHLERLSSFLTHVFAKDTLSSEPLFDGIFLARDDGDGPNPFEVDYSALVAPKRSPLFWHRIIAIGVGLVVVGYLAVGFARDRNLHQEAQKSANGYQIEQVDEGRRLREGLTKRQGEARKADRVAVQRYVSRKSGGMRWLPTFYGDEEVYLQQLATKVQSPAGELVQNGELPARAVPYFLAVVHACSANDLARTLNSEKLQVKQMVGLDTELLGEYLQWSKQARTKPVEKIRFAPYDPLRTVDGDWLRLVGKVENANEGELDKATLIDIKKDATAIRGALAQVQQVRVALRLIDALRDSHDCRESATADTPKGQENPWWPYYKDDLERLRELFSREEEAWRSRDQLKAALSTVSVAKLTPALKLGDNGLRAFNDKVQRINSGELLKGADPEARVTTWPPTSEAAAFGVPTWGTQSAPTTPPGTKPPQGNPETSPGTTPKGAPTAKQPSAGAPATAGGSQKVDPAKFDPDSWGKLVRRNGIRIAVQELLALDPDRDYETILYGGLTVELETCGVELNRDRRGEDFFTGRVEIPCAYTAYAVEKYLIPTLEAYKQLEFEDYPEAKTEVGDLLNRALANYNRRYRRYWLEYVEKFGMRANSMEKLLVILSRLESPTSPLQEYVDTVKKNTQIPMTDDTKEYLSLFKSEALAEFDPIINLKLEDYMKIASQLRADLIGAAEAAAAAEEPPPEEGGASAGPTGTLESTLRPEGTLALRMLKNEPGAYDKLIAAWERETRVSRYANTPFDDPINDVRRLGTRNIKNTLRSAWRSGIEPELGPVLQKFPFNAAAKEEATPKELEFLFKPNTGRFFVLFRRFIEPVSRVDPAGFAPYNRRIELTRLVPERVYAVANSVVALSRRLWDDQGAPLPFGVIMYAEPLPVGRNPKAVLSLAYLRAGEQSIINFNQSPDASRKRLEFDWTSPNTAQVGIRLTDSETRDHRYPKPITAIKNYWSLLKLLRRAQRLSPEETARLPRLRRGQRRYTWRFAIGRVDGEVLRVSYVAESDPFEVFRRLAFTGSSWE